MKLQYMCSYRRLSAAVVGGARHASRFHGLCTAAEAGHAAAGAPAATASAASPSTAAGVSFRPEWRWGMRCAVTTGVPLFSRSAGSPGAFFGFVDRTHAYPNSTPPVLAGAVRPRPPRRRQPARGPHAATRQAQPPGSPRQSRGRGERRPAAEASCCRVRVRQGGSSSALCRQIPAGGSAKGKLLRAGGWPHPRPVETAT